MPTTKEPAVISSEGPTRISRVTIASESSIFVFNVPIVATSAIRVANVALEPVISSTFKVPRNVIVPADWSQNMYLFAAALPTYISPSCFRSIPAPVSVVPLIVGAVPPAGNTCTSRAITEFAFNTSVSTTLNVPTSATSCPNFPPAAPVFMLPARIVPPAISAVVTVPSTTKPPSTAST